MDLEYDECKQPNASSSRQRLASRRGVAGRRVGDSGINELQPWTAAQQSH